MMHIKNHNKSGFVLPGFTLVEVMLVVAIVGIAFPLFLSWEMSVSRAVSIRHGILIRLPMLSNMYSNPVYFKNWKENTPYKAEIEYPETKVEVSISPASSLPGLEKFENLYISHVKASWTGYMYEERFLDAAILKFFVPPKKKEAKKE